METVLFAGLIALLLVVLFAGTAVTPPPPQIIYVQTDSQPRGDGIGCAFLLVLLLIGVVAILIGGQGT